MARTNPALERHVEEVFPTLEALLGAAESVERTVGSDGWTCVMWLLEAETDAVNAQMESTTPLGRAEYAVRHGRIGGLRGARQAADAIIAVAERRRAEQQSKHEGAAESSPER